MLDWELWVTRAENGFIVRWMEDIDNGTVRQVYEVFENAELDEWGMHEAMVCCLRHLVEHFGLSGSKHDATRIAIDLV